jgi:hypothetical protein
MQSAKQQALETLSNLPDDTDMEEILYRLYVLDKIRKGRQAVEEGETVTADQLGQDIETW